jgi:hypothetical protein
MRGGLGEFADVPCLWAFLPFHYFEFDLVTFLKTLIALRRDRAVMNEDIRSVFAPNKTESLSVVEPLDRTLQT